MTTHAVVEIGYTKYVLPLDKAVALLQLFGEAVRVSVEYDTSTNRHRYSFTNSDSGIVTLTLLTETQYTEIVLSK